jgi:hypothetical protein
VSQIAINSINSGLTAGVFKLGLGETIAVTYDTLVPTGNSIIQTALNPAIAMTGNSDNWQIDKARGVVSKDSRFQSCNLF